uniref:Uncharacterized protein n=1 Tax=Chelydra serpentina TaxID=8475 RepID=A0A8C3STR6_CHESE
MLKIDEVLSLMSHIAAKVPSHNAVPSGAIATGIYLLYMSCNIFLNVIFLQGLSGIQSWGGVHLVALNHNLSVNKRP